jgi:hypothetical protein
MYAANKILIKAREEHNSIAPIFPETTKVNKTPPINAPRDSRP